MNRDPIPSRAAQVFRAHTGPPQFSLGKIQNSQACGSEFSFSSPGSENQHTSGSEDDSLETQMTVMIEVPS